MKTTAGTYALFMISLLLQACSDGREGAIDETATVAPAPGPAYSSLLAALPADTDPADNTFQTLDGRGFDIGALAGRKVFVNFWATWCAPCIREIPSINRAAQTLEAEGYLFLFASDEDNDTIRDFLTERAFGGNFIRLNGYFATYGIGAVPSSWLLDENGDVVATWAGAYEWDSAEMIEEIRHPPL